MPVSVDKKIDIFQDIRDHAYALIESIPESLLAQQQKFAETEPEFKQAHAEPEPKPGKA